MNKKNRSWDIGIIAFGPNCCLEGSGQGSSGHLVIVIVIVYFFADAVIIASISVGLAHSLSAILRHLSQSALTATYSRASPLAPTPPARLTGHRIVPVAAARRP